MRVTVPATTICGTLFGMRSRAVRLALVGLVWIAFGAAGLFVSTTHQRIRAGASSLRQVDQHARETADALADLRLAQHSYVASGQGVAFWMPKVAATRDAVTSGLTALRQSMMSAGARAAVDEAAAAIGEFADVDKRARDYVHAGQLLMASDVIFTEGGQLVTVAARQVETARLAEHEAFDTEEAGVRQQQALAMGAAGALIGLSALILALTGARPSEEPQPGTFGLARPASQPLSGDKGKQPGYEGDEGIVSHAHPDPAPSAGARPAVIVPAAPPASAPARNAVILRAAADLATDLGRVRDSDELERLLARTADLIDATGLVVWMGGTGPNGDLRPVLAHGYTPQVLARMPAVPRSADNAAAAAYRTGSQQIVLSRPGGAAGAIVAPILGADGCIGALSAEIKDGGEGSEAVQAVATIVAAHLASVLAVSPADLPEAKVAHQ
jgi:hypothetical protein